jgi:hypothetical protein
MGYDLLLYGPTHELFEALGSIGRVQRLKLRSFISLAAVESKIGIIKSNYSTTLGVYRCRNVLLSYPQLPFQVHLHGTCI